MCKYLKTRVRQPSQNAALQAAYSCLNIKDLQTFQVIKPCGKPEFERMDALAASPATASRDDTSHPHPDESCEPDASVFDLIDKEYNAQLAKITGGLSLANLASVYSDWAMHLASAPGKQAELVKKAFDGGFNYQRYILEEIITGGHATPCIEPKRGDRRFRADDWHRQPFAAIEQAFLLSQDWWDAATTGVRGVSEANEKAISFGARQFMDALSPTNSPLANPEVWQKTGQEGGMNFAHGMQNYVKDLQKLITGDFSDEKSDYAVGKNLAVTPGKVVYRNHLIELIQYDAVTEKVRPEPLLIVPAWIMKYYILDLSQKNSMVRYMTEQGFTVFMISWRNPDEADANLTLEDYRKLGPMAALDAIEDITGAEKIHAAGYCLGGTLLSIAATHMAREDDERLTSMTLFTAQSDFTEAGELMLFINESQIAFLEDQMWDKGFLDAKQMSGAFQLLRSNDLIWSHIQHAYMMGEDDMSNDLMAWNADSTRMPYKMHSQYLRKLFLNNELATGHYIIDDKPISLSDLHLPIFAVGTETDHVAPWKSAFKIDFLSNSPVTFVLTKGGHNAGVISEPGHARRHYRIHTRDNDDHFISPEEWVDIADLKEGSWWEAWSAWLGERSGAPIKALAVKDAICDAPGTYVMVR